MNKYPIVDEKGNPIKSSKWMGTEAQIRVKCPRCGCGPGFYCETPKGRAADSCHGERSKAYSELSDFDITKHQVNE